MRSKYFRFCATASVVVFGILVMTSNVRSEISDVDQEAILEQAILALGGRENLDTLVSFSIESKRVRYVMGQGPEPGIGLHRYSASEAKIFHSVKSNDFRGDFLHTGQYIGAGGVRPVTEIVVGSNQGYLMGFNDFFLQTGAENEAMTPERLAVTTKTERLLNPHFLIQDLMQKRLQLIPRISRKEINSYRVGPDEIFPITLSRFRETGKRILVTNDVWLKKWKDTKYFKDSVAERVFFEVDSGWLSRWQSRDFPSSKYHQLIVEDDVYPITLYVNKSSGLIEKLSTMEKDYVYGDVELEVTYSDWEEIAGVSFPMRVKITLAGAPSMDVNRSKIKVNPKIEQNLFLPPAGVVYLDNKDRASRGKRLSQTVQSYSYAAAAKARELVRPTIEAKKLGQGVYLMIPSPSDATYTMVVELEKGILIIEPGMDELKCEAVIDWIELNFPDKPITYAVISHNHADHAVGFRTYSAAGATIVVHEDAEFWAKRVLSRNKSSILPDALDRNPVATSVLTVADNQPLRLRGNGNSVIIYPVYNRHSKDMLILEVENQGILYLGDLYIGALARMLKAGKRRSADGKPTYSTEELYRAIQFYGIEPKTMIGSHDSEPVSYNDFLYYLKGE
jgi:glyoxylase-like metal-dependent hydrolase (beta-lactamase superfamily II)